MILYGKAICLQFLSLKMILVDRTPVLYFDMVNLEGQLKKYLLKFDRKDGFDKNEIRL